MLKNCKAGGSSGIFPELVKVASEEEEILVLPLAQVHAVWDERQVPQELVDTTITPSQGRETSVTATTVGKLHYCMWLGRQWLESYRTGCSDWWSRNFLNLSEAFTRDVAVKM